MDKEWYSAAKDINVVNELYEMKKRRERTRGSISVRAGRFAYELKGLKSWQRTWIFNTETLVMKPAK